MVQEVQYKTHTVQCPTDCIAVVPEGAKPCLQAVLRHSVADATRQAEVAVHGSWSNTTKNPGMLPTAFSSLQLFSLTGLKRSQQTQASTQNPRTPATCNLMLDHSAASSQGLASEAHIMIRSDQEQALAMYSEDVMRLHLGVRKQHES